MNKVLSEYINIMSGTSEIPTPPEDTEGPTVSILVGETTDNSIAVTINATDVSGIATYKYYINGTLKDSLTTNSYTFTGLSAETQYTITVEAFDNAGNKGEDSVTISTMAKTVQSVLRAGDYVIYPSSQGDIECRVLYDSSSEYGIQIITNVCVGSDITLGSDDSFSENMASYNNAIITLNDRADDYINSSYSTMARCVGSNPTNPSAESDYAITQFGGNYSGKLRDGDTNYETDKYQMETLGIMNIEDYYWVASRSVDSYDDSLWFYIRAEYPNYGLLACHFGTVKSDGSTSYYASSYGLRPVFNLKPEIKITGGDGSSPSTAYTLGT